MTHALRTPPTGLFRGDGPFVPGPVRRDRVWVLAAIAVLGAVLRAVGLDSCLWYDEVVTLTEFVRLPLPDLIRNYADQNQHPLFSVLAHLSVSAFGESAWALRLPAAVFGAATPLVMYFFARRIAPWPEPLLAAALVAVSYHHVWFSQSGRGYTVLVFAALVGSWLLLENLRRPRASLTAAYGVVMALALYTHLTAAFVVAGHGLMYVVLLARKLATGPRSTADGLPFAGFVLAAVLALLLYAPVLPEVVASFRAQSGGQKIVARTGAGYGLTQLVDGLRAGFGGLAGALAAATVVAAGLVGTLRSRSPVLCLLVLPAGLAVVTMLLIGRHLYPRLLFSVFPFGVMVIVHGVMVCGRLAASVLPASSRPKVGLGLGLGLAAAAVMLVLSAASLGRNYRLPKQDYAGAMAYLETVRDPRDPVVAVGMAGLPVRRYFAPEFETADTDKELAAVRGHSPDRPTWLIYTFRDHLDVYHPEIAAAVDREFVRTATFPGTLNGGEVIVCRADPIGCRGTAP